MTATASLKVNLNVRSPTITAPEALGWNPLHPADPEPDPGDFSTCIATAPGSPRAEAAPRMGLWSYIWVHMTPATPSEKPSGDSPEGL